MAMVETTTPRSASHCCISASFLFAASISRRVSWKGASFDGLCFSSVFIFDDHDTVWEKCTLAANAKCNVTLHPTAVSRPRHMRLPDSKIRNGQFHAETWKRGGGNGIILSQGTQRTQKSRRQGTANDTKDAKNTKNSKDRFNRKTKNT